MRAGDRGRARRAARRLRARWLLAVAVAAAGLWSSAEARATHPGCPEWPDGLSPYPYPFHGVEFDLPECRLGARGTADHGTHALLPHRINMRRPLGSLEPNPAEGGRVRWALVDSFGRSLAVLERHADRWETTAPDTGTVIYRDRTLSTRQFTVQGRGCMVSDELESRHALVAFDARDRTGLGPGDTIVPFQLRAFIDRAALPEQNEAGQPIRAVVDDYSAGCGASPAVGEPPAALPDTDYDSDREQFYGQDGLARTYATYNVKHRYRNARYFLIDTTGVGGGGIVRGVVRAEDPVAAMDGFAYCDPNRLRSLPVPVATWTYGQVAGTRMSGWFPRRCRGDGSSGEIPGSSPPPPPPPSPVATR